MNGLSGNKKIIISIVAFILVMAVLVGGLLVISRKDGGKDTGTTSNISGDSDNEGYSTENTTSVAPTMSPAMNVLPNASEGRQIEAYISGKYYISATMYADGVASDMNLAIDGYDFHTTIDMDGMKMGIMFRNDNVYVINNNEKKFIDFNSLSAMMGNQMNFDLSELREITSVLNLSEYNFHSFDQSEVDLNGQKANCYCYYADELSLYFYFVAGELRQIDYGDPDGKVATSISVNAFSPTIPSDMLSLIGLKQATIFDFFGEEFMQQLQ